LHAEILVNGMVAQIVGTGSSTFNTDQARRAATYRLDLTVPLAATDTDGDGIPDWWEDLYGTDKQDKDDADDDPDGDWIINIDEYLAGTDPTQDNRLPVLAATVLRVYADGTTGLGLTVNDADSAPGDLRYTLESVPDVGTLYLRNAAAGATVDLALTVNSTFTQADVAQGKLVYVHPVAITAFSTSFGIMLQDENPAHDAVHETIVLNVYRPGGAMDEMRILQALDGLPEHLPMLDDLSAGEKQAVENYLLSRGLGHIVWDGSERTTGIQLAVPTSGMTPAEYAQQYVPQYGAERSQILCGGFGADTIEGGMEADIIVGGPGIDILSGHGGADLFVFNTPDDGNDIIVDFDIAECDAIDIGWLLAGISKYLSDYVLITSDGSNTVIGISIDGSGEPYDDIVITVKGTALAEADIYDLVDEGCLRIGSKVLRSRIALAASVDPASENGPTPAEIKVSRRGDATEELTVDLQISGSAQNGVDYLSLPSQVTLAAGQTEVSLIVSPNVDAITELQEIVEVSVLDTGGYVVGDANRAVLAIEDLAPQVSIEALEPVAVQNGSQPGVFLVRRAGVIDRSLLVRLAVGGTAANGQDYETISAYINLMPNQTTALIEVVPMATAVLDGGTEYVTLANDDDPEYVMLAALEAQVVIVEAELSLQAWKDRYFPGAGNDLVAFAEADNGQTGIPNFVRYAFGLDPDDPAGSTGQPVFTMRDGRLVVSFRRPAAVADVEYIVEVSDDLENWSAGSAVLEQVILEENQGDPEMTGWRTVRTAGDAGKQFVRVRVVYTP